MPHLRDADGNVVAGDLTPAEINRLQQEGVPVTDADGDDAGDEPGPSDADGGGADDAPEPDDADTGGGGGGGEPADDDPDADDDPTDGGGGGSDPADPDDDPDPVDDPTSAGSDGSAAGDEGTPDPDVDAGPDPDDAPDDAPDDQTHGPDAGPDLDLDDLDDPDEWDEWDDEGAGAGGADTDDAPDDADGEPQSGGGGGSDPVGPDNLDDAVDDMLDRSDDRDVSSRAGDDGIDDNHDRWQDRVNRIRSASDIPEATRERDTRMDDPDHEPHVGTDEYQPWAEGSGFIDDMVERFKKIQQAPKPSNAMRGSSVDRKRLTRFRAGDTGARDFYLRSNGDRTKARRAVGVALDLSGSMGDPAQSGVSPYDAEYNGITRLHVAKLAVAGLAHAVETIGDTFTATGFREGHYEDPENVASAPLITAPDEQFEWRHLDSVAANYGTPMGYGVRKAAERLLQTNQPDKTLFVIADGNPTFPNGFNNTEPDARGSSSNVAAKVQKARASGVQVVGVGIGDVNEEAMYNMFRESETQAPDEAPYVMADAEELPTQLAELYEDTLK